MATTDKLRADLIREVRHGLFTWAAICQVPGIRRAHGEAGFVRVRVGWWRWVVPGGRKKIKRELSERLPAGVTFELAPWWW